MRETNCVILWIVTYPMDSIIQLLNRWDQKHKINTDKARIHGCNDLQGKISLSLYSLLGFALTNYSFFTTFSMYMQAFLMHPHHMLFNASGGAIFLKRIPSLLDKSNQPVMFSSLWIKKHSLRASSPFERYREKYTHNERCDGKGEKPFLSTSEPCSPK